MNKFQVYLWIEGASFDAEQFNSSIAKNLAGEVKSRKHGGDPGDAEAARYWKSEVISPAENRVEEELLALLIIYKAEIRRAENLGADRVFAQIVGYMEDIEHLRGYYLSKDILHMLSELNMELDIDIVPILDG